MFILLIRALKYLKVVSRFLLPQLTLSITFFLEQLANNLVFGDMTAVDSALVKYAPDHLYKLKAI